MLIGCPNINSHPIFINKALIMHQYAGVGNIIGMIVLNLEVVNLNRAFQQLVLDFFDDNIFAVDEDENIARAEVCRVRPALGGAVERMRSRSNDFLTTWEFQLFYQNNSRINSRSQPSCRITNTFFGRSV